MNLTTEQLYDYSLCPHRYMLKHLEKIAAPLHPSVLFNQCFLETMIAQARDKLNMDQQKEMWLQLWDERKYLVPSRMTFSEERVHSRAFSLIYVWHGQKLRIPPITDVRVSREYFIGEHKITATVDFFGPKGYSCVAFPKEQRRSGTFMSLKFGLNAIAFPVPRPNGWAREIRISGLEGGTMFVYNHSLRKHKEFVKLWMPRALKMILEGNYPFACPDILECAPFRCEMWHRCERGRLEKRVFK